MKKRIFICILLVLILAISGCGKKQTGDKTEENARYLYYLNNAENQLVTEEYKPSSAEGDTQGQVGEYLEALMTVAPKNPSYKKAVPESVVVTQVGDVENEQLTLSFNSEYKRLSVTQEILCRAAIVKTLCQVEDVTYVSFLVDGQPLKDSLDKPIGFMTAEDFIDNTGGETKFEQNAIVTLYFSDKAGEKLLETRVRIRYDGAVPIEQLVIEQLVKGPASIAGVDENEVLATIPEGTKLSKITVKDGICYVDFNEAFLKKRAGISDEIAIYSVVDSLIEIPAVNKVQITVNGEAVSVFGDGSPLDIPFERNLDIIKKEEQE